MCAEPVVEESPGVESTRAARPITRVVVCAGSQGVDTLALHVATRLASALRVSLTGLYVIDERLRQLAALPNAREFTLASARARQLSQLDLRHAQRVQMDRFRTAIAALADPLSVAWSLEEASSTDNGDRAIDEYSDTSPPAAALGMRTVVSRAATRDRSGDLLVFGRARYYDDPGVASVEAGLNVRQSLVRQPVAALFDASEAGRRTLRAAAALVRKTGGDLVVLVHAASDAEYRQRQAEAARLIGSQRAHYLRVGADGPAAMRAAAEHGATVLARPRGDDPTIGFARVYHSLACALLLIP